MSIAKAALIVVLVIIIAMTAETNAQAYGLLPDPTPSPEPTVEPSPTPMPEPEVSPTPEPESITIPESSATPEPTPTVNMLEPIPAEIIMKAIKPRAFIIGTETAEEKLTIIADNIDSITTSLNFLKKRGFDISGMLEVLAQITEGLDGFTEKQIDSIANITATIDEEIVTAIFTGGITQQDIDGMAVQLADAMKQLEDVPVTEGNISSYEYGLVGGVIVGVLLAMIWAVTLKI